jgi:hypothetical protein
MNVEIGTESMQFIFCEYLLRIFGMVSLQCIHHVFNLIQSQKTANRRLALIVSVLVDFAVLRVEGSNCLLLVSISKKVTACLY